jgi:prevent-host-death family protein
MAKKVSAANAKAHFSELVASVAYGRERYIIERRGKPLAALVSLEDLAALQEAAGGPRGAIALVGAWSEVEDRELDSLVSEVYAERERDTGREVSLGA